jgi:hypothetical protein
MGQIAAEHGAIPVSVLLLAKTRIWPDIPLMCLCISPCKRSTLPKMESAYFLTVIPAGVSTMPLDVLSNSDAPMACSDS